MIHALGRIHVPDERDAQFPASLHLMAVGAPVQPVSKSWAGATLRLDQGDVGACVGFAAENWRGATPVRDKVSNADALSIYAACKQIDGMPGEDGTSDRFSAQVLVQLGLIERYLWATAEAEFLQWLSHIGPVMVGTDWTQDMFTPDSTSTIHATGAVAGGHEYLVRQLDLKGRRAKIRNSWGATWGQKGEAWISLADLFNLVYKDNGDALCAVEKVA
jgi:hypothetical protein